MSIINNIQGTLTQTHQIQQMNQQAMDHSKVQQQVGELQNEIEQDEKRNSINEQEDVDLAQMNKDGKNNDPRKRHQKKKTLEELEKDAEHQREWRGGLGGGLIDTQA
jgi:hypothetical protein